MLFMNIYTFEPGQRDAIIKRRMEKGTLLSEGVKVVGEWSDLGGGRGFMICEANDPQAIMTSAMKWDDLMKEEIIPLLETAKLFPEEKGKGGKK
ncbi:MAG: DUF3303 domain-containing protein [Smithella sp.]